jgi:hypothetical protein
MPDKPSVSEAQSRREVHANDPKDGRHFGTFLVQLPVGVAPHRDLADDMALDAVKEVFGELLKRANSGYTLTVHPAEYSSRPEREPQKSSNGCGVWFTWAMGRMSIRFSS